MKGQAAMEYLMTYGWAILIVVAVIAALYAMGVFRIGGTTVPCSPCFSYFAFVDYSSATKDLVIRNGPKTINITSITDDGNNDATSTILYQRVEPGATITITGVDSGETITITYVDLNSGLSHTDSATLH